MAREKGAGVYSLWAIALRTTALFIHSDRGSSILEFLLLLLLGILVAAPIVKSLGAAAQKPLYAASTALGGGTVTIVAGGTLCPERLVPVAARGRIVGDGGAIICVPHGINDRNLPSRGSLR